MSNALAEARAILDSAGYRTMTPHPSADHIYFEDGSILGALYVLDSISSIVTTWESLQDAFLTTNAVRLNADPLKAWNCYTAFLTAAPPSKADMSTLANIEEDFRGTRKLVRAGVMTRGEIETALAPLLPLRRLLTLAPDDIKARLASRLGEPGSPLQSLLSTLAVDSVAAALLEQQSP